MKIKYPSLEKKQFEKLEDLEEYYLGEKYKKKEDDSFQKLNIPLKEIQKEACLLEEINISKQGIFDQMNEVEENLENENLLLESKSDSFEKRNGIRYYFIDRLRSGLSKRTKYLLMFISLSTLSFLIYLSLFISSPNFLTFTLSFIYISLNSFFIYRNQKKLPWVSRRNVNSFYFIVICSFISLKGIEALKEYYLITFDDSFSFNYNDCFRIWGSFILDLSIILMKGIALLTHYKYTIDFY